MYVPLAFLFLMFSISQVICLEYLRPKGFVMRDRMEPLDLAHTSLAFRALGRLHALSFALRDQRPDIFGEKIAILKEAAFTPDVIADETMITRFKALGKLVETVYLFSSFSISYGLLIFQKFSRRLLKRTRSTRRGSQDFRTTF